MCGALHLEGHMRFISLYKIGNSHQVCEDYSAIGKNIAALADGCSSSLDTDTGARILVNLMIRYPNLDLRDLIKNAMIIALSFSHPHCLDCTLGSISIDGQNCLIQLIGDGVVVLESKNNTLEYFVIDYEHNAPVYLSYLLGSSITQYKEKFGNWKCEILNGRIGEIIPKNNIKLYELTNDPIYGIPIFKKEIKIVDYNKIYLFSDGLGSFVNNGKIISIEKILFKLKNANFDLTKIPYHHYDDLSYIAILND